MKKTTFLMSLSLFATLILSSCGGGSKPAHTHTYGEGWKYDETNHWHECTANDGAKDGVAAHTWGEGKVTTPATCTEDGIKTFTCLCGATKTETITHSGHKAATEWQSDKTHHWHNCTNEGCYDEVDKAAHDFEEDMSKHEDPTCIKKGKQVLVCKVCQAEVTNELDMIAHDWDDGVITKDPDCEHTGVKTFTCDYCKTTRTEVVDAKGHKWESKSSNEAFQYSSIGTWQECSVCHATKEHSVTTKAPWSAFDLDDENKVICEHEDPTAWDKTTHTLTSSNFNYDNGVKFIIADNVDTTRLVVDVTLTVNGQTKWGPQGSFFFYDADGNSLGSVFCLKANPLYDVKNAQFRTTPYEKGAVISALSEVGAEFTYRFDFRGFDKAPRSFIINGANGQPETPDIICIKSIIVKETACGHTVTDVKVSEEVESTCKVAGHTTYACSHQGCGSVEYTLDKALKDHTPKEIQGATEAFKYDFGGKMTVCSACGEIIDDKDAVTAPWAKVDTDDIKLVASTVSTNAGHTATRSVEDGIVSMTGYYNANLWADAMKVSKGRNIISITLKPSAWKWGGYCFYMHIYGTDLKDVATLPTQFYAGTMSKWTDNGGKIYNDAGEEVSAAAVALGKFFTFEIDLTPFLKAGDNVKAVSFVSGYDADDSANQFANVPTLSIKDVTFKESFCGHKANCIEEREVTTQATCATSVVDYCTKCDKVVSVKSTTFKDGYAKQDLTVVNGVRGSSAVYDKTTTTILNTCNNQFGPMFDIPTNVDEICLEMKVLSADDIDTATFFFYLSEAKTDISWGSRYAYDVKAASATSITNPANDTVCYSLTDTNGDAITSWGVGDTFVLKINMTAVRDLGFAPITLLLGTKNSTAIKLNTLVYHTTSAE